MGLLAPNWEDRSQSSSGNKLQNCRPCSNGDLGSCCSALEAGSLPNAGGPVASRLAPSYGAPSPTQFAQLRVPIPLPGRTPVPLPLPFPIPPWVLRKDADDDPPYLPPANPPRRKSEDECEQVYERNIHRCGMRFGSRLWQQRKRCEDGAFAVYAACLAGKPEPRFDPEDYAWD